MKTKSEILADLIDAETRDEIRIARPSLRERVAKLRTHEPDQIRQQFGVVIKPLYWGTEDEKIEAARKAVLEACKVQAKVRRARRKAEEIGLAFWPALLWNQESGEYNSGGYMIGTQGRVDPLAFVAAEQVLLRKGNKPWGTKFEEVFPPEMARKNKIHHGGWDSCGHYGVSPETVATCWFASGCKDSRKFRWLIRHGGCPVVRGVKSLSICQLRDLTRGSQWLQNHCQETYMFATKTIIALGRISPAARKAAIEGLDLASYQRCSEFLPGGGYRSPKIRIRDLNWTAVKRLQTMAREEIVVRYLRGRYAWQFLTEAKAPEGMEKVLPPVNREALPEELKPRVKVFADFTLVLPEGYAFGDDDNGQKIFKTESPEEDYHFEEEELKGGIYRLVKVLERNADIRRQRREEETYRRQADREFDLMMKDLSTTLVTRFDSYRAGNCAAGTKSFADRYSIDLQRPLRADRLWRIADRSNERDRALGAIRAAWQRETLVMI